MAKIFWIICSFWVVQSSQFSALATAQQLNSLAKKNVDYVEEEGDSHKEGKKSKLKNSKLVEEKKNKTKKHTTLSRIIRIFTPISAVVASVVVVVLIVKRNSRSLERRDDGKKNENDDIQDPDTEDSDVNDDSDDDTSDSPPSPDDDTSKSKNIQQLSEALKNKDYSNLFSSGNMPILVPATYSLTEEELVSLLGEIHVREKGDTLYHLFGRGDLKLQQSILEAIIASPQEVQFYTLPKIQPHVQKNLFSHYNLKDETQKKEVTVLITSLAKIRVSTSESTEQKAAISMLGTLIEALGADNKKNDLIAMLKGFEFGKLKIDGVKSKHGDSPKISTMLSVLLDGIVVAKKQELIADLIQGFIKDDRFSKILEASAKGDIHLLLRVLADSNNDTHLKEVLQVILKKYTAVENIHLDIPKTMIKENTYQKIIEKAYEVEKSVVDKFYRDALISENKFQIKAYLKCISNKGEEQAKLNLFQQAIKLSHRAMNILQTSIKDSALAYVLRVAQKANLLNKLLGENFDNGQYEKTVLYKLLEQNKESKEIVKLLLEYAIPTKEDQIALFQKAFSSHDAELIKIGVALNLLKKDWIIDQIANMTDYIEFFLRTLGWDKLNDTNKDILVNIFNKQVEIEKENEEQNTENEKNGYSILSKKLEALFNGIHKWSVIQACFLDSKNEKYNIIPKLVELDDLDAILVVINRSKSREFQSTVIFSFIAESIKQENYGIVLDFSDYLNEKNKKINIGDTTGLITILKKKESMLSNEQENKDNDTIQDIQDLIKELKDFGSQNKNNDN